MIPSVMLFDVDGTLVPDYRNDTLLPTVVDWLRRYSPQQVALCSNQGGVGLRHWMEIEGWGNPESLPTEAMVRNRLNNIAFQVRWLTGGHVCALAAFAYLSLSSGKWSPVPNGRETEGAWYPGWRKPAAGMLVGAMAYYGAKPADCLFVGDHKNDRLAAENAGVRFEDARIFFEGTV